MKTQTNINFKIFVKTYLDRIYDTITNKPNIKVCAKG